MLYMCVPAAVVVAMWGLSQVVTPTIYRDGEVASLGVSKCQVFNLLEAPIENAQCTTVMFAPDDDEIVAIMQSFSTATGLEYGVDVVAKPSALEVGREIAAHPGAVGTGVIFKAPSSTWAVGDRPVELAYELWVNTTGNTVKRYVQNGLDNLAYDKASVFGINEAVQQAVDAAIIGHKAGLGASADMKLGVSRFPEEIGVSAVGVVEFVAIAMFGEMFMTLGCSLSAILVLQNIASEKEAKLLGNLRVVGLREWAHWLSWAICYIVPCMISAMLAISLGISLDVRIYTNCDFLVMFLNMFLFLQAMSALYTFLGSFVSRNRIVVLVSMLFLVISMISTLILKILDGNGQGYKYGAGSGWFWWTVMSISPWFHFNRIWSAVAEVAYQPDTADIHYFAAAFLSNSTSEYTVLDERDQVVVLKEYELGTSLWVQAVVVLVYNCLAWWTGQVFSAGDGSSQPAYFCLLPRYWFPSIEASKKAKAVVQDDTIGTEKARSAADQSVRCYKLSKAFAEETALKEFSMSIERDALCAILGANGAGKSTLIKTLIGIHPPTHGSAFIFGLDVAVDVADLQRIMGVCAQDDLLWLELTAREHLRIYARLKALPVGKIEQEIERVLDDISLANDADNPAGTYSGGMKRRLSVGIASIGSPQIIFLDEPSTGMDPLSKRRVWAMIQRAKRSRVVLLTTHSMEEADALGDKIAIMHNGRLRAVGTSLFLKSKFGKGHTVSILSDTDKTSQVKEIVMRIMPTAEIIASNAGNTSISLPRGAVAKIPKLFSELTSQPDLVKEWGLSNTTLEEVFLRLAAQDHDVNTAIQQEPSNFSRVMIVRSGANIAENPGSEVVVVLEGPNADLLQVVTPEEYMLKVLSDDEEEDEGTPLLEQYAHRDEVESISISAEPTRRLQYDNPLEPVPASMPVGGDKISDGKAMREQVVAVVWKDTSLAFGCSKKGGGCTACCTFKCCELGCYIVIFLIFGLGAVLNEFVEGFGDPEFGAAYCPNGVLNQTGPADAIEGWADKTTWTCPSERDGQRSAYRSVCWGQTVHGSNMRWSAGGNPNGGGYAEAEQIGSWLRNNNWECAEEDRIGTNLCDADKLSQMLVDWASPMTYQNEDQLNQCLDDCARSNNGCQDCSTCQGCWPCCRDCQADCELTPEQSMEQCQQTLQVCARWGSCFEQMGPQLVHSSEGQELPPLEIWYSMKDSQMTDLANLRVFPNRTNWNSPRRKLRKFESAGDIDGAVRSAQDLLRNSKIGLHLVNREELHLADAGAGQRDPDTCPWATYHPDGRWRPDCYEGRTLDDPQTAVEWWATMFPAMALELNQATIPVADRTADRPDMITLHYDLRLWSRADGQSFRYTDVSAAVWGNDGSCDMCYQVGPTLDKPNWPEYGNGETAKNVRRTINTISNIVLRSVHPVLEDCRCDCTCDCGCEHCTDDRCDRPLTEADYLQSRGIACGGNQTTCGQGQPAGACFFDSNDRCDEPWNNCQPDCVDCSSSFVQGDPSSCAQELGCVYFPAESCSVAWLDCGFTPGDSTTCRDGCTYTPAWVDDGFDREHDCEFRLDTTYVPMPLLKFTRTEVEEIPSFWLIMMPMLTMFLIPSLASMLAMEKEEGLLEMVKTEGGTLSAYLLGNYLFCFIYSVVFSSLFILVLYFSGADDNPNVQLPWFATIATIIMWSHAQTCFCGFLGFALFSRARHAAIAGVLLIPLCSIAGWVITAFARGRAISWMSYVLPPLAYSRTVGMLLLFGGGLEWWKGLLSLFGWSLFYGSLAVVLLVHPDALKDVVVNVRSKIFPADETSSEPAGSADDRLNLDDDVQKAADDVLAMDCDGAAIVVKKLLKTFNSSSQGKSVVKRAVDELCLAIPHGEVFGLLGPNGAGKTTAVSILTGLTSPNGGEAYIQGFDIATQMQSVHKCIGVCPQFDKVWPDLSVRQHLEFYCMLKGVPLSRRTIAARKLAEKVELAGDAFNKPASALSGGMRRRLSIAIALTESPPVLFFDEPTTGLDPETRRSIWGIIQKQQAAGKTAIVTTHSMEEADALCARIGIMAGGQLRCLGTQLHLKSKFGDGFKMVLSMPDVTDVPGAPDALTVSAQHRVVEALMLKLSQDAKLVTAFGKQLSYTLPLASTDVSKIFNTMEEQKRKRVIAEWGLSQASLEEVFMKVVTAFEEKRNPLLGATALAGDLGHLD